MVLADFARLIGVDQIHIGTGIGKLEGDIAFIEELNEEMEMKNVKATKNKLEQKWGKIKPVFSVSSGGLHPGHVPFLVKHLGKDLVIQAGGGIHGHPFGTEAGAVAMRQALDSVLKKIPLERQESNQLHIWVLFHPIWTHLLECDALLLLYVLMQMLETFDGSHDGDSLTVTHGKFTPIQQMLQRLRQKNFLQLLSWPLLVWQTK